MIIWLILLFMTPWSHDVNIRHWARHSLLGEVAEWVEAAQLIVTPPKEAFWFVSSNQFHATAPVYEKALRVVWLACQIMGGDINNWTLPNAHPAARMNVPIKNFRDWLLNGYNW